VSSGLTVTLAYLTKGLPKYQTLAGLHTTQDASKLAMASLPATWGKSVTFCGQKTGHKGSKG